MNQPATPPRCRLVLVVPAGVDVGTFGEALRGGDVASAILARDDMDDGRYGARCAPLVAAGQRADVAMLVADREAVAQSCGADGIFLSDPGANLKDAVGRFAPGRIVGCGGIDSRHAAMVAGEAGPDFLLFGRLDGDTRPHPHPKSLDLAEWWSQLAAIPAIVMAGSDIASIRACARTGAEFVAAGLAVFAATDGPAAAVREINRILAGQADDPR
jgi:thiamine-phosphate pyrophosphorylase